MSLSYRKVDSTSEMMTQIYLGMLFTIKLLHVIVGATSYIFFVYPQVLVHALQVAEILMEKLPETFSKVFAREWVVHAVDQLVLVAKPLSHACF